jgi:hypothetical protein
MRDQNDLHRRRSKSRVRPRRAFWAHRNRATIALLDEIDRVVLAHCRGHDYIDGHDSRP